jgi:hypothetical protein
MKIDVSRVTTAIAHIVIEETQLAGEVGCDQVPRTMGYYNLVNFYTGFLFQYFKKPAINVWEFKARIS